MSDRVTPRNPVPAGFPGPDFEIFVMNADGSNPTQITVNDRDDEVPAWSPNGKKIVFQRDFDPIRGQGDYDILTMRADGTRERNLTNSPGVQEFDADWSPDGRRIAFVSERDGDGEIYTMKPDGSRVRQLTVNDGPFDGEPELVARRPEDRLRQRPRCRRGDPLPGRDLHDARRRRRPDQADVRRSLRLRSLPGRRTAARSPSAASGMPPRRTSTRRSTRCARTAAISTSLTREPGVRRRVRLAAAEQRHGHHGHDEHHGDDD